MKLEDIETGVRAADLKAVSWIGRHPQFTLSLAILAVAAFLVCLAVF